MRGVQKRRAAKSISVGDPKKEEKTRVSEADKIFGKRLKSLIAMRERTRGCLVITFNSH